MTEMSTTYLRGQLLSALAGYEAAKRELPPVVQCYQKPGRHPADAKKIAEDDPRYKAAVDDCQLLGAEIVRYGVALLALHAGTGWDEHVAEAVRHTIQEVR